MESCNFADGGACATIIKQVAELSRRKPEIYDQIYKKISERFGTYNGKDRVSEEITANNEIFSKLPIGAIEEISLNLLHDNKPEAAFWTTEAWALEKYFTERTHLLRCECLARLKAFEKLRNELNKDRVKNADFGQLAARSAFIRLTHLIDPEPTDFRYVWGAAEQSIEDILKSLDLRFNVCNISSITEKILLEIREKYHVSNVGFHDDLVRGHLASRLYMDLHKLNRLWLAESTSSPTTLTAERKAIVNMFNRYLSIIEGIDKTELQDLLFSGRSVVVALAHVGTWQICLRELMVQGMPYAFISNGGKTSYDNPRRITLNAQNWRQSDFLKLIKLARSQAMIIIIAADGPAGADFVPVDMLGTRVPFAQGAATLAYYTKASTYFAATKWSGPRIKIDLKAGPDPASFLDKKAWTHTWLGFYAACLSKIILGPPRDIGAGEGGIITSLRKAILARSVSQKETPAS